MTIKKTLKGILFVSASLVFVLGFASMKKIPSNNIYSESTKQIIVDKKHPFFVIKLKSNPTTGFTWGLLEYNKNLIENTKRRFIPGDTKLIGASGFEEWSFHMKDGAFRNKTTTKISFAYARPWEKNAPAQEITFTIKVQ